ncbi:hypothetical protein PM082_015099 [Marasmius tenuissimus]|nr:hypothetical protein PM082_015099 [Marasmius tenuissimus]
MTRLEPERPLPVFSVTPKIMEYAGQCWDHLLSLKRRRGIRCGTLKPERSTGLEGLKDSGTHPRASSGSLHVQTGLEIPVQVLVERSQ